MAWQPSHESVSTIVSLLTDVHQPGANQGEVRVGAMGMVPGRGVW